MAVGSVLDHGRRMLPRQGRQLLSAAARRSGSAVATDWIPRLPVPVQRADSTQLGYFQSRYQAASGYRVDLEYLERSRVYVLRSRRGLVVGGYVVSASAPLRTLVRVPPAARGQIAAALPPTHLTELTCVWLEREVRDGIWSIVLWACIALHLGSVRRSTLIFGTEVDSLRQFYERVGPTLLYDGEVVVDGHPRYGWIYGIDTRRWPGALRVVAGRSLGRAR